MNPAYYGLAKSSMAAWHGEFGRTLLTANRDLLSLTEADLKTIESAYDGLASKIACKRKHKEDLIDVTFGPTGAAKILFALRPQALVPWDDPVRKHFGCDGSGSSYCRFLRMAQAWMSELSTDCQKHEIELSQLPEKLNQSHASPVKLADEYLWVTITQKCPAPDKPLLERWVEWS